MTPATNKIRPRISPMAPTMISLSVSGMGGTEDTQVRVTQVNGYTGSVQVCRYRQVFTPVNNQWFIQAGVLHHTGDLLSRPSTQTQTNITDIYLIYLICVISWWLPDHLQHILYHGHDSQRCGKEKLWKCSHNWISNRPVLNFQQY